MCNRFYSQTYLPFGSVTVTRVLESHIYLNLNITFKHALMTHLLAILYMARYLLLPDIIALVHLNDGVKQLCNLWANINNDRFNPLPIILQ